MRAGRKRRERGSEEEDTGSVLVCLVEGGEDMRERDEEQKGEKRRKGTVYIEVALICKKQMKIRRTKRERKREKR